MVLDDLGNSLLYLQSLLVPYAGSIPYYYLHVVEHIEQLQCTSHMMVIGITAQTTLSRYGIQILSYSMEGLLLAKGRTKTHPMQAHDLRYIKGLLYTLFSYLSRATMLRISSRCFALVPISVLERALSFVLPTHNTITKKGITRVYQSRFIRIAHLQKGHYARSSRFNSFFHSFTKKRCLSLPIEEITFIIYFMYLVGTTRST